MYSIDNNRLAKQISDLSNTDDRNYDKEFYERKTALWLEWRTTSDE